MSGSDTIEERANKIFGKLQTIQTSFESEKQQKFKLILNYLQSVESAIEDANTQKNEKFLDLAERVHKHIEIIRSQLQRIKQMLEQEKDQRDLLDEKIKRELHNVERNCKNMLSSFSKERIETEKKVFGNLSQQVDALSNEIFREFQYKTETQQRLQ